jgi:hypothetical protein
MMSTGLPQSGARSLSRTEKILTTMQRSVLLSKGVVRTQLKELEVT